MTQEIEEDPWWDQPECRRALADSRWDRVLAIAMRAIGADQRGIADATGLAQSYISRVLSGARTPDRIPTLIKLCDGLGIPRSRAGLLDADEEAVETVRSQAHTVPGAIAAAGLLSAIGGGDLAALASPTRVYRNAEASTAARLLRAPTGAHLRFLQALAVQAKDADSPVDYARLQVLIAEAAGFAAWLALDGDEVSAARQQYLLAVRSAEATNRPLLTLYMRGSLAQFVSGTDDHVNARRLASRARATMPRSAPPIARVWLDCIEATILASAGDPDSLDLLDAAERGLTDADPVWPWLTAFDAAKLEAYRQSVDIRLRRHPDRWPVPQHPSRAPHPKVAAAQLLERADALVDLDQPEQACVIAATAFDVGRQYQSEAITRRVIAIRTRVTASGREVDNLDARLAGMY